MMMRLTELLVDMHNLSCS